MSPASCRFLCVFLATVIVTLFTIDLVEAARGGRGGGKSMSRGGPAASGSFQRSRARPQSRPQTRQASGNRSGNRQDVRQNRSDNRWDRVDDRQDFRREVYDDRKEYRSDRREWYEDRWRRGRYVSVTSWRRIGCNNVVIVNGIRYYECGGVRYERVYRGSEVTYIIVN